MFTGIYRCLTFTPALELTGILEVLKVLQASSGSIASLDGQPLLRYNKASVEDPGSTLLVEEGVTGIYRTELHDRPTTYTSGFFRFYRSLQV